MGLHGPLSFRLGARIVAGDKSEFDVVVVGAPNVTVLPVTVPPPAPVLQSAVLSDDGTALTVELTSASDRAKLPTRFDCLSLLNFVGADKAKCRWVSEKVHHRFYSTHIHTHTHPNPNPYPNPNPNSYPPLPRVKHKHRPWR
jgi:hypothetical protein